MDIHAPEGPIHSLKEFAVHILVVTIGILIAFGLEGWREVWREDKAVSEARESFQQEMRMNRRQLAKDVATVKQADVELEQLLKDLPKLATKPEDLAARATSISPGFYFFRTTSWEAALASGIVAHMSTAEVNRLTNAYLSTKNYQDAQKGTIPTWISVRAFFGSHHWFSPADLVAGEQMLRTFDQEMQIMEHLAAEFDGGLKEALGEESAPSPGK